MVARLYDGSVLLVNAVTTDDEEPVAVHFGDLVLHDNTLKEIRALRAGDVAFREFDSAWRYQRFYSDSDFDRFMQSLPG